MSQQDKPSTHNTDSPVAAATRRRSQAVRTTDGSRPGTPLVSRSGHRVGRPEVTRVEGELRVAAGLVVLLLVTAAVAIVAPWGRVAMDQVGEWLAAVGTAPWEVQVAVGVTVAVVLMVAAVLVSRPR
jgi:hypothetical protein